MKIKFQALWFIVLASVSVPSLADDGFLLLQAQIIALQKAVTQLQTQVKTLATANTNLSGQVAVLTAANVGLNGRVTSLTQTVNTISVNSVLKLDKILVLDPLDPDGTTVKFNGVNVQIMNGSGRTSVVNGLGNLIIGYDEPNAGDVTFPIFTNPATTVCSDGAFVDEATCLSNNGTWGAGLHLGSHNLVVGSGHSYTSYGGFIAGFSNVINREYASVSGGSYNVARGVASSVSGGQVNWATEGASSVCGGLGGVARGDFATVCGGLTNTASGLGSSVSGGEVNVASGSFSSVSGGHNVNNSASDGWAAGTLTSP